MIFTVILLLLLCALLFSSVLGIFGVLIIGVIGCVAADLYSENKKVAALIAIFTFFFMALYANFVYDNFILKDIANMLNISQAS